MVKKLNALTTSALLTAGQQSKSRDDRVSVSLRREPLILPLEPYRNRSKAYRWRKYRHPSLARVAEQLDHRPPRNLINRIAAAIARATARRELKRRRKAMTSGGVAPREKRVTTRRRRRRERRSGRRWRNKRGSRSETSPVRAAAILAARVLGEKSGGNAQPVMS